MITAALPRLSSRPRTNENRPDTKRKGDRVIQYGCNYGIEFKSFKFNLFWRKLVPETLKALSVSQYLESEQTTKYLRPRDQPTEVDLSNPQSWCQTALHSVGETSVKEVPTETRPIGDHAIGSFGQVFRSVDEGTGAPFAIKVVSLRKSDRVRALFQREIETLSKLRHHNIIKYQGSDRLETDNPRIFMPLRPGNLSQLTRSGYKCTPSELGEQVLKQMLSALDYLACEGYCHRDLKPANILYTVTDESRGNYTFELADFGLVNFQTTAATVCGTRDYMAPEVVRPEFRQSPKMDVWSLFVTILTILPQFTRTFPLRNLPHVLQRPADYDPIFSVVIGAAKQLPKLRPMAELNPEHRATAAQMLLHLFNGVGLTTQRDEIPPIQQAVERLPPVQTPIVSPNVGQHQPPAQAPRNAPTNAPPNVLPTIETPQAQAMPPPAENAGRPHRRQQSSPSKRPSPQPPRLQPPRLQPPRLQPPRLQPLRQDPRHQRKLELRMSRRATTPLRNPLFAPLYEARAIPGQQQRPPPPPRHGM
ncbi:kinase-like domain-containing protein [Bombardia bombarda]|uniref:Kinase-like domain-containing protein n=1 Tax=Bombardia bombarda TaxID=252184 RepID=A0AA39WI37_9PEZI|nr:kinase-like domain-containing protein [Bombardia bombarda]